MGVGARLHVLTCDSGVDQGYGVPWPESACQSDLSNFVGAFDPGPRAALSLTFHEVPGYFGHRIREALAGGR